MRTGDELAMNAHTPSEDWPERDEHGHLVEACTWESSLAEAMAAADGIELSRRHWQVIEVLREFYAEYEIAPPMRALVKILRERLNEPDLASRELYRLFPDGPAKQGSRYAGLPKPVSCV